MNNQFSPLDYSLDQEYRNRQEIRSEKFRQSDDADNRPSISSQLMQANIISSVLVVASLIALMIMFGMGAGSTSAQTFFDEGTDSVSDSGVHLYLVEAVIDIRNGEMASAKQILEEALLISPEFAALYMTLSFIELDSGNIDAALASAEIAASITPDDPAVYFMLAQAQFANNAFDDARNAYDTYIDMVAEQEYQPILVTTLLNGDSMPIVTAQLDACTEALAS